MRQNAALCVNGLIYTVRSTKIPQGMLRPIDNTTDKLSLLALISFFLFITKTNFVLRIDYFILSLNTLICNLKFKPYLHIYSV